MEYRELEVETRESVGSGAVKRMRKAGSTPAVIYSDGSEARHIAVNTHKFTLLGKRSGHTQLFKLKCNDAALDGKLALVKDVQLEPLKGTLLHVDFLAISEGHRINIEVPLKLKGEVAAVKEGRAVVNQGAHEIQLECLPTEIPDELVVEIGHLREGQSIHASDIKLPQGAVLRSSPGLTIVSIVLAKKEEVAAAATAEGAAAEGAESAVEGSEQKKTD